ncbi:MAG: type II toxin-antitoxin system RelB/DinJ family antitoxin, partial [Atopobium sp.]|nr:type II toxin-antitoxin system RelB/DinJ family antitoxin [Atopobium sp.]
DLTTAITIFLRQTVREQGIPFEIKRETPNAQTIEALNEYTNMKEHPENYKHYASFSDAMSEVLDA